MTSSPSDDWRDPLRQLREGIEKLKQFAASEANPTKKADLDSKIDELERRAANYIDIMKKRELGEENG